MIAPEVGDRPEQPARFQNHGPQLGLSV